MPDPTVADPSYEISFWGDCCNSLGEELKQTAYAVRMGMQPIWGCPRPPMYDLEGRTVVDLGGGPASILLKCVNLGKPCAVVDPGPYPAWVKARYKAHGVKLVAEEAEEFSEPKHVYDEAWIYNALQHVRDPEAVIETASVVAEVLRIFEWIGVASYEGHPHELSRENLDEWIGQPGFVAEVNELGAVGTAYYGVFSTASD